MGSFFGLRGKDEHADLLVNQFTYGTFVDGDFVVLESVGSSNLLDKSCHVSVRNSYRRDISKLFQLPIVPKDADSPGTILWNYVRNCLFSGQLRLHSLQAHSLS